MSVYAISELHLTNSSDKPMEVFGGNWENYYEKIVADWQSKVKEEDIVLIAGDISWAMTTQNAKVDFDELAKLNGKKVIIKGNHDYWWGSYSKVKKMLPEGFFAIQNNAVKIGNCVFCGTRGWVTTTSVIEGNEKSLQDYNIYQRELIRLRLSLDNAKNLRSEGDVLILLTHFPPFNAKFENSPFTDIINEYKVDKVVYGHLHGDDCRAELEVNKGNVTYYLTSCDKVNNKLVLIEK